MHVPTDQNIGCKRKPPQWEEWTRDIGESLMTYACPIRKDWYMWHGRQRCMVQLSTALESPGHGLALCYRSHASHIIIIHRYFASLCSIANRQASGGPWSRVIFVHGIDTCTLQFRSSSTKHYFLFPHDDLKYWMTTFAKKTFDAAGYLKNRPSTLTLQLAAKLEKGQTALLFFLAKLAFLHNTLILHEQLIVRALSSMSFSMRDLVRKRSHWI